MHRTRLSLKKRGTSLLDVVAMVKDILIVASIIKAKAIMNGIRLESPMLPVIVGFSDLMEFGWLFVASVRPGVVLLTPTLLVLVMPLF